MAEIAVCLATKAAQKLLDKLVEKLYNTMSGEVSLLLGIRGEIKFIKNELQIMNAFLRRAEEIQDVNEAARAWVMQVREVAYDIEDCIDEVSLYLLHSEEHGFVSNLFRPNRWFGRLGDHRRLAAQITSLKSEVEEVSRRRLRYQITELNKASSSEYIVAEHDPRMAALFVEESQLVGIEEPKKKLLGWLLNEDDRRLSLVAVVGGGGLGKTTIVRKAYESPNVTGGFFQCRAWITVSQQHSIDELLKDMIRQIFPTPPDGLHKMGMAKLIEKLRNHLEDKRYVIVFDDLWKPGAWNSLALSLPKNELGSRVMITTRINKVAESCHANIPGHIYQPETLSDEKAFDLFCRRVFPGRACPDELGNLSRDILKKCDGLPLAIVAIAGVLASKPKKDQREWRNMIERLGSELQTNTDLEGMKKILTLSYNDLPYNVKRCFLYLGKFPEDCLIKRKRVQGLWIAEGLISDQHDMTDEEVSESYFNELVNRYMILPSTFSADGKVRDFRVHDVILELIVSKSTEDNFLTVIETDDRCMPRDAIRRLSIHGEQYQWIKSSLTYVRSYTLFVGRHDLCISSSMRLLRVLDLEGCRASNLAYVLSKVIAVELLHLKYLSLRETELHELPKTLGNLRYLETLDIVGTDVWKIPRGITELLHLRFLRGGGIKVPEGIGNLRNLQELAIVDVGRRGVMQELDKLTKLKKLALKLDSTDLLETKEADFYKSLTATSSSLHSQRANSSYLLFLLNSLSSPPLLLESLGLHGELGKMPNWIGLLSNLQKLSLERSNLDDDSLKALGALPNLLQLKLGHLASKDDVLSFGSQGFPSLKVLILRKLRLWSLNFEEEAMPSLELLSSEDEGSANFRILGIKNLTGLKEIKLKGTSQTTLELLKLAVDEHPNHPKLATTYYGIYTMRTVKTYTYV